MATAHQKSTLNIKHSAREIVSDSLAIGVAFALGLTIVQRLIGFIRNILFCRLMTPEQLGQWSMVFSFLMLLAPFAVIGLPGSFGRFVEHYRKKGQLGTVISRTTKISTSLTIGMSLSMFVFPETFSRLIFRSSDHVVVIYMMGLSLAFVTMMNFLVSLVESLRQVRLVTMMRFISSVVFAIVACVLLVTWENAAAAATVAYGFSCMVASVPALWFLWNHRDGVRDTGEQLTHRDMWSRIAPFAMWLWMVNIITNLFEFSDRYMLIQWSAVPANIAHGYVGQYHSGRAIPLLMVGVATMLESVLMPYLSVAWEERRWADARQQVKWTIKLISLCFTFGGTVVLLFAPLLFSVVLEGRYDSGLAVMPLTLVYCIWLSLMTVAQAYIWLIEKGRLAVFATFVGLAINIVLNMLMIPYWGLWGAVIATAYATFLTTVLVLATIHRLGCRVDSGVLAVCVLPAVLLLPVFWQIPILFAIAVIGIKTSLFFPTEDKVQISELVKKLVTKVHERISK